MTLALMALAAALGQDEQTMLTLLASRGGGAATSWILMNVRTGSIIGVQWREAAEPVPVGSLVKPFAALAYGAAHGYRFPVYQCSAGCWLARGHGKIGLVEALAQSCNSYFDQLARETDFDDAVAVARRYGFDAPPPGASLAGRAGGWKAAPVRMAGAYCELARRAGEPGVDEVLRGFAASANHGTAQGLGDALAKTGTAPCTHTPSAPGDGFAIVLFPAREPAYAVLVRLHGAPGAAAARKAGEMLRPIRDAR